VEMHGDLRDGEVHCLSGRDLFEYDYISIRHDRFVPVNVKPTVVGRLEKYEGEWWGVKKTILHGCNNALQTIIHKRTIDVRWWRIYTKLES
jgi:hypothetical protein